MPNGDPHYQFTLLPHQGWQCPVCMMVMSPSSPSCWNCKPKEVKPEIKEGFPIPPDWLQPGNINTKDDGHVISYGQTPYGVPCETHEWEYLGNSLRVSQKRCKLCKQVEKLGL